jgi:membrane-associated protease RseP (regulator of RpoE activity)
MLKPVTLPVGIQQPEARIVELQRQLWDVFAIAETRVLQPPDEVVEFRGTLQQPSDRAYEAIGPRFKAAGYTALLYRDQRGDVVQALKGVEQARPGRVWVNLMLLALTLMTTLMAGALVAGVPVASLEVFARRPELLLAGLPFSSALLLILGVHEMGHYVAGKVHRAAVTLPYFIPLPPFGVLPLGTLGAFIQLRSPIRHRRALFDIGLAGPAAGLVVAVAVFAIGVSMSRPVLASAGSQTLGRSLFTTAVIGLVQPIAVRPGMALELNPLLLAGWLGLFVTVINLLPIGQLDGGHILYAAIGRNAQLIGLGTIGVLLTVGYLTVSPTWILWGLLGLFFGVRHAPTLDDITPLDPARRALAVATLVVFALIFVPVPFR